MEQGSDVEGYMGLTSLGSKFVLSPSLSNDFVSISTRVFEIIGTIPWAKPFMSMIPGVNGMQRLQDFSKEAIIARRSQGSLRKDIFYYLISSAQYINHAWWMKLDEEGIGNGPSSLMTLMLESSLAIVAGNQLSR